MTTRRDEPSSSPPKTVDTRSQPERFQRRHIGPTTSDQTLMLRTLGLDDIAQLIDTVVPTDIRSADALDLPPARTETEALDELRSLAERNSVLTSLIGTGYHDTVTPAVILRNVLESPAWYTAYTPYQPEISQGRLEALLNFQTMICDITGLEIANASMLDEATAAAESMTMAMRSASKVEGRTFFVDRGCHPQVIDIVATRAEPLGIDLVVGDPGIDLDAAVTFGALLAHVTTTGAVVDLSPVVAALHDAGAVVAATTDLLACTITTPPGEMGVDVVVGSAQRFGVPMGYGGPHAAFLATTERLKRALPGRLVGVSVDTTGRTAYRLALQTREQHIRREKATSNICTAQVLLAVIASMYAVYHGPEGLRSIARRVHDLTLRLAEGLRSAALDVLHDTFFDTVTVRVEGQAEQVVASARAEGILLRLLDEDHIGISLDETTTPAVVARVLEVVTGAGALPSRASADGLPLRSTSFMTHPTFHSYHSETEMLRYLRTLADRDIALDRAMIPLGSCTMKLNATSEMIPITWAGFSRMHPFAPADLAQGYRELFTDLEAWLAEITGYDAVSLQPNAGSQGEYAGLLAIRSYHRSRGEQHRNVCLIPSSAHGTNAASAVMAGMRVVVVACDDHGNVDVDDLRSRAVEHAHDLAAVMITYPSTHGVFEAAVREICAVIHDNGGQVYLDGANMNALVGLARPGRFGADVSHLNLHKTFCIPHGGGGPGVGPIGVRAHLAEFLPGRAGRSVAAAPWGSASILPISWAYIAMMGPDGLRDATEAAILSANYVARRLSEAYPVLYSGEGGFVAHECIIDIRPIEKETGVTAEDIAKRLIDYGFHAPTMSFPVPGTLMVEPTESESLAELDRFCDAMLAIAAEIERIRAGEWPLGASPLRLAPHPAEDLLVTEWLHPYSRETAAYPAPGLHRSKYWPPVSRIDNGYGDRNLVCSCPPIEEFAD